MSDVMEAFTRLVDGQCPNDCIDDTYRAECEWCQDAITVQRGLESLTTQAGTIAALTEVARAADGVFDSLYRDDDPDAYDALVAALDHHAVQAVLTEEGEGL